MILTDVKFAEVTSFFTKENVFLLALLSSSELDNLTSLAMKIV